MDPVFLYDFGSPNAYLVHRVIPAVQQRTGVRFRYQPVLLGGLFKLAGNQAPIFAFANIPTKLAYQHLEIARFVRRHAIPFQWNPHFPVNTLLLMRAAVAAEAEGIGAQYVEAMFHFMWEEPRKLDDPAVLAETLSAAGLPAERLLARAQEPEIKAALAEHTQRAFEQGAFGIPSFLLGDELYFGKEGLRELEEDLLARA
jgi:2-hydroxychromene-2-carboxylate isomerase